MPESFYKGGTCNMADAKTKKEVGSNMTGGDKKRTSKSKLGKAKKTKSTKTKVVKSAEKEPLQLEQEAAPKVERIVTSRKKRIAEKVTQKTKFVPVEIEKVLSMKLTDLNAAEYEEDEYNELLSLYEGTIRDIKEGEIVSGTVIGVTREDIIVDVGFKSEGIIPISEFVGDVNIAIGDPVDVFLEAVEDQNGQLVLSKQKADFMMVWDRIRQSHDAGELVPGKIKRRIKGGVVVDIMGVDAFLPGSQIALRQVPDFDALIGQTMDLKIIKLNKSRRNIVVSRRVVLEEERESMRNNLLEEIALGQERQGVVKNITDFGVFIDLGGVDGLLHITDMSWGRMRHPSEMVQLGDDLTVKILDFDEKTSRISLGLKQMTPYPWENIEEKYPLNKKVKGRVVSITDYGAFVELEKGIEGLIHISEMSWTQHIKHPSKIMSINDTVEAVVLSVDKENEKISLGIKQMEPDPWTTVHNKYPVNSIVEGKVRNLTAFGAFVEIEEGIDGLVHISDMSWTKRVQHPSEIMKKGENIDVKVLRIDSENRRVSLGIKQLKEDPWPGYAKKYGVDNEALGEIVRIMDRGLTVELDGEVEGFVPANQLGKEGQDKPADAFNEGDKIPLKIIEFDRLGRKIVLSVSAYFEKRDREEYEAFMAKQATSHVTLGEAAGNEPESVDSAVSEPAPETDSVDEQPAEKSTTEAKSQPTTTEEPTAEAAVESTPTDDEEKKEAVDSSPSDAPTDEVDADVEKDAAKDDSSTDEKV